VCLRVLVPSSRARDVGVVLLQMWAYLAAYEMPNDDPAALERRVRISYPVRIDRVLGLGTTPTVRMQRRFGVPGRLSPVEKALVWSHWLWFAFPHGTAAYVLLRDRNDFPRAAALIYATFDIGVLGYWALPTAPPWYAARRGLFAGSGAPPPRRIMVEYGAEFWGSRWERMYGSLAGNPLAAMPSLHFATSVTAAHVLAEHGRRPGAIGWTYAGTLAVALVYLGEHYVIDLLAGLALAEGVRLGAPAVARRLAPVTDALRALEEKLWR
jgi:membrane-associated phospholipid phosphatase